MKDQLGNELSLRMLQIFFQYTFAAELGDYLRQNLSWIYQVRRLHTIFMNLDALSLLFRGPNGT